MDLCGFKVGLQEPLFAILGPCVIESESLSLEIAEFVKKLGEKLKINVIYKASFDKANRTSITSFRGLGIEKGLAILAKIKREVGIPVLTDVHENMQLDAVTSIVDVLQTPAFLCRQTDFISKVAQCGLPVNIKKGQFLAPQDMQHVAKKAHATGNKKIMVCERGVCFGYNNLVVDMRSLVIMRNTDCPVIFDATHSVQLPGGAGIASGGQREFVPTLAQAAVACGVAGIFMETHPNPEQALSDGPNSIHLHKLESLLSRLQEIDFVIKQKIKE